MFRNCMGKEENIISAKSQAEVLYIKMQGNQEVIININKYK